LNLNAYKLRLTQSVSDPEDVKIELLHFPLAVTDKGFLRFVLLTPTCMRRGEFSSCTTLKLEELPPRTLKKIPEYFELISDHSNVGQIVLGSG
jgi:hypothetical protein